MPGKNVKDQLRAINHTASGVLFDIALLHRREIAVENDKGRIFGVGLGANFVELAASHERGRVGGVAQLKHSPGDVGTGATGKLDELSQRLALGSTGGHSRNARRAFPGNSDQKSAFGGRDRLQGSHRRANKANTDDEELIKPSIRRNNAISTGAEQIGCSRLHLGIVTETGQPVDIRFSAKPGELTLGILPGSLLDGRTRSL